MTQERVAYALKTLWKLYLKSWLLLLSHALCICIGAAWMYLAIRAALVARGVL